MNAIGGHAALSAGFLLGGDVMSRKAKTAEELQAEADRAAAQLKKLRAEARKAKRVEEAKAKEQQRAREIAEAMRLIEVAKRENITLGNGEETISIYEFLQRRSSKL